jgi:hypothetical protein
MPSSKAQAHGKFEQQQQLCPVDIGWPTVSGGFSRHPQVYIRQGNDCHTLDSVDQMGWLDILIIGDYLSDE